MKKLFLTAIFSAMLFSTTAQENIDDLLAAGVNDAKRYAAGYLSPALDGALYSITGGWFTGAITKKPFRFEVGVIGNAAIVKDNNKSFLLNTSEYEFLRLRTGVLPKT